ncbi:beta-glucosidase B [Thozetella sp. PMI_491]|nr:beta-glucosidase B [Thozetella sp. PMI_491]
MAQDDRIEALLQALTLQEKCSLLGGKNMWETYNVDRLGIRSLKLTDGPAGVRGSTWTDGTHTTFIPCGISLAATFDPDLIERIGDILGAETRTKSSHVLLAPTMNISRSPLGGRNFENFGEDPYLTGIMATRYIAGVQKHGVGACMKHFVANDMETRRFNMDEQIDERTLREIYLRPFEMAQQVDPWTAMAAYPKINGEHADCSNFLLRAVLRGDWGFDGLVVSDWGGTNDTVKSIVAGTDLEMPGPPIRYGAALLRAVEAGQVSESDHIDTSVRRLLKLLNRAGLLDPETTSDSKKEQNSDLPEFRQAAREAASGAIVLLKNDGVLPLQPQSIKKLAIIGPNAKKPTAGGTGSAAVNPYYITTPYESLSHMAKEASPSLSVSFEQGIHTNLQPSLPGPMLRTPDGAKTGVQVDFYRGHEFQGPVIASSFWQNSVLFMMSDGDTPESLRGSSHCYRVHGILTPTESGTYDLSLSNTGKAKLYIDDEVLIDNYEWTQTGGTFMNCGSANRLAEKDLEAGRTYSFRIDNVVVPPPLPPHDNTLFHTLSGVRAGVQIRIDEQALFEEAVATACDSDAVVLVVGHNNDTEKEGIDRTSMLLPRRTNELVEAICAANPRTVVVTQSASAIAMPWADCAPAIVHAWFQGQENGNAIADILLGRTNPSGKLPVTFPKKLEDHGSNQWFPGDAVNDYAEYGEGVLVGYRWFDAKNIEPLWPFGFGLSYTTFAISDISVEGKIVLSDGSNARVSVRVANTGSVDGAEVVQFYVSASPTIAASGRDVAPRSLAGFAKIFIPKTESRIVHIDLGRDAVRWFEVEGKGGSSSRGKWRVDPGVYKCFVATSSRQIVGEIDIVVE